MFSKIIRLGAVVSSAAILSSCGGGSGQTLTQQDTPEGLFSGTSSVYINASGAQTGTPCTQNMLVFVEYAGVFYSFATDPTSNTLISAASGSLSYSGGIMSSSSVVQVMPPSASTTCGVAVSSINEVTNPNLTGGYSTGVNFAGTFNYPLAIDAAGNFQSTTFNINYNVGYQGIQSLATLAGTYAGTVGTSQFSEAGTFTFGPASVPANSENQFGVGIISGTGASGCSYTGTVSPLFKGNGYSTLITSGGSPCRLPNTQFSGLVYLDTSKKPNHLYSFSPDQAHTDGLIFTGTRN